MPGPEGDHRPSVRLRIDYLTRSTYSPVRVSIRIFSPGPMKGGTWTLRPVSSVASLYWLVAVAPLIDGGVSVTTRSIDDGDLDRDGLVADVLHHHLAVRQQVLHRRAEDLGREAELVERLGVHEDVLVARGVEVFVLLGLDVGDLDLVDRAEPLVDQGAAVHVPELGLDHGSEVAGGVVGEIDHDEVDPVHGDYHPASDIGGLDHHGGARCPRFPGLRRFEMVIVCSVGECTRAEDHPIPRPLGQTNCRSLPSLVAGRTPQWTSVGTTSPGVRPASGAIPRYSPAL